ncbi:MAG: hypothetical protein L7S56_05875 [Candidatus Poseidonia sp.]|nr:hypothetical protein [Poseidonia sp.]
MAILLDEQGTEIYAGRGKYSRHARTMIEQRKAYVRNDEGDLSVYVPPNQTPESQRASTLQEDARSLKRDAQELGQQLGLGLDEIEIRRETPEGVLVAHLKQLMTPAVVAGLDSEQAAKLMQTISYWMLRQHLTVFEHDELVRNLHQLINSMRVPSNGAALLNRDNDAVRESAVNVLPGAPTSSVYNELWVHAFLPPNGHQCRPSVSRGDDRESNMHNDGRVWNEPALLEGPEFVCQNLDAASNLASFRQGRHGVIRLYLPYNPRTSYSQENDMLHGNFRDRGHLPEFHINPECEPWEHCLQRFIDACAFVKNNERSDLRLFIHRGAETPQEVIL